MKLIIWDLDGILWTGTLAEGGIGSVNYDVVEFIKTTESLGVVHSVCSNNSLIAAKKQLETLGIWDLFVFPNVEFGPKGNRVTSIIESCQLRATDVLFVDDNQINLNEALFYSPDLKTSIDTNFISTFTLPKGKSRTKLYKILEAKSVDKNNAQFLQDSNINIALVENNDCLLFSDRIVEMVNRANVLNFSRTRFSADTIFDQLSAPLHINNYAVFAWDKYGYYGLIGYFSIEKINLVWQLNHFVFSCRTLTMGIENFVAKYIQTVMNYPAVWKYNPVDISGDYSYITLHKFKDVETYIREQEQVEVNQGNPEAKIYAFCHSSVYWILTNNTHMIDYEVMYDWHNVNPNLTTENFYNGVANLEDAPRSIIFAAYNEFKFENWWKQGENVSIDHMRTCVDTFVSHIKKTDRRMLVLLPDISGLKVNEKLVKLFDIWESHLDNQITGYVIPRETENFRVWTRDRMHQTAMKIVDWVNEKK